MKKLHSLAQEKKTVAIMLRSKVSYAKVVKTYYNMLCNVLTNVHSEREKALVPDAQYIVTNPQCEN